MSIKRIFAWATYVGLLVVVAAGRDQWQDLDVMTGRSALLGVPQGAAAQGVQYTGLSEYAAGAPRQFQTGPIRMQQLDDDEGEDAPTPAVPVVPVADNYEAATNADDLITKALEHGTLSAAQAKAILAAAKAAAAADAAKVYIFIYIFIYIGGCRTEACHGANIF
jgi:hypothetical protein